ncbi:GNAT family N-acetyltransferase [Paenibacillus dakarensis]|uniref:GNAT family N-acetyltransferase n=1 Tax=Paenibacillus dakarensis TaxID=1527293 RepID=UPI0006D54AAC|nr:GNAT family N-acetyltransferase [Paenibacillus dakarensis]
MNPMMLEFPEQIETERLLIRAPLWGDGVAVNEAIIESIEDLRPWLPFANNKPSVHESEAFVRKARLCFLERTDLVLHLFDRETGAFVGSSGLHHIDWKTRRFEIGYWLRSSCTGKGLAAEAVNGISNFAVTQLGANRVEIRIDSRNTRSRKVAVRTGFSLEGTLRNWRRNEYGDLIHLMVYSKVRGAEYQ